MDRDSRSLYRIHERESRRKIDEARVCGVARSDIEPRSDAKHARDAIFRSARKKVQHMFLQLFVRCPRKIRRFCGDNVSLNAGVRRRLRSRKLQHSTASADRKADWRESLDACRCRYERGMV